MQVLLENVETLTDEKLILGARWGGEDVIRFDHWDDMASPSGTIVPWLGGISWWGWENTVGEGKK